MQLKVLAKVAVVGACRYLGINRLVHRFHRSSALVLCYHGIVADPPQKFFRYRLAVSVAEFDWHLRILRQRFHPISAADLLAWFQAQRPLPDHAVLVTFDDGYRNNLKLAAPLLRKHGIPCIFHVATGYIGDNRILWTDEVISRVMDCRNNSALSPDGERVRLPASETERRRLASHWKERCKRLPWSQVEDFLADLRLASVLAAPNEELSAFLNWDEVRELCRQGFDIGSHTVEHPILSRVPAERLRFELAESKRHIERETGKECLAIAYPNGGPDGFSQAVIGASRDAGYRLGFTTIEDFQAQAVNALAVRRLCIMGHLPLSSFDFRVSGSSRLF